MKENDNRVREHRGLREKLPVAAAILLIIVLFISVWKIGNYLMDDWKSRSFVKDLRQSVIIRDEGEAEPDDAAPGQEEETDTEKEAEAPDSIDFDSLHEISGDAAAWIYDPDGEINYVIAQAKDNDYYLRRLLDGTEASGGTLFMDFRNNKDLSDWNTVIYGHNMKNGTMFATLLDYRRPGYYDKHPVMYLYTPEQRYRIELIAGYTTSVNHRRVHSPMLCIVTCFIRGKRVI